MNMSEIDNAGVSEITFQLGNTTFTHKFIVSKILGKEILLGINFVYGNQIKLLYHDDHSPYLEFGEDDCIDLTEKYPVDFVVKATENTQLPPYHFTVVKCCISQHAKTVERSHNLQLTVLYMSLKLPHFAHHNVVPSLISRVQLCCFQYRMRSYGSNK